VEKNSDMGVEEYMKAAEELKLTAQDLKKFEIIDDIIPEPLGGAHREPHEMGKRIKNKIVSITMELEKISVEELVKNDMKNLEKLVISGIHPYAESKKSLNFSGTIHSIPSLSAHLINP